MSGNNSVVIWLTGISGAGKTTLGREIYRALNQSGIPADFLDGDTVREFFEGDLGYSRADRIQNVRRVTFAAKKLSEHGVSVVVANIAPYFEVRDFIRRKLGSRYIQIYLKSTLETVQKRDVKGLYSTTPTGSENLLIGRDDPYDEPRNPDLVVDTSQEQTDASLDRILRFLKNKGVI